MTTKIITIANQKGGIGKTTTVINLAHGLAQKGKAVLVVDFDPQGHVAEFLNVEGNDGAYSLLMNEPTTRQAVAFINSYVVESGRKNLWVLPGSMKTARAQNEINGERIDFVRNALEALMLHKPDYILIDTSPSVGGIQERAIWAADFLLVPTATEHASITGVVKLFQGVQVLCNEKDWKGKVLGLLPTMFEETAIISREYLKQIKDVFGEQVLPPIHRAQLILQCTAEGVTIFEKDAGSRAAQEYRALTEYVLNAN